MAGALSFPEGLLLIAVIPWTVHACHQGKTNFLFCINLVIACGTSFLTAGHLRAFKVYLVNLQEGPYSIQTYLASECFPRGSESNVP